MHYATEGASSKKTLGTNLSGRWNHDGTQLWRARIQFMPPKGKTLKYGIKLSGKRTEKGRDSLCYPFLFFFAFKKGSVSDFMERTKLLARKV